MKTLKNPCGQTEGNLFIIPESLLEKYDISGPRYTSYPTVPVWQENFDSQSLELALSSATNAVRPMSAPLSLYIHLPFCTNRCLFCSCNVIITQQREQIEKYLSYLFRELEARANRMDLQRPVIQFHLGGGTPTYLSPGQLLRLFEAVRQYFSFDPGAEIAIEVDPRVTTPEHLAVLYELGFNRISMGVQDFDPVVQAAVHRIQPVEQTETLVNQCRKLGFQSINIDLIYGLPHQNVETFSQTLDEIIHISPDRIALYNFAYVPWISPHQKYLSESELPSGAIKFRIFSTAIQALTEVGYVYIGMDHFAKPTDELMQAQQEGTLHRNFMGFTTKAGSELHGFGVSAISGLRQHYAQNWRKLSRYYDAIDQGILPIMRGYALTPEDLLRRVSINAILCQGKLDYAGIEQAFEIGFEEHFAEELRRLQPLIEDGLLQADNRSLSVTPLGRIFSRNIAMVFDAYLSQEQSENKPVFSRTL